MSSEIQNAKSMPESDKGCVSVSKNQGASRVAFWGVILFSTSAVLAGSGLFAGPKGTAAERSGDGPAVIELFTSQGCYSCPPAEKLLGELIESHPDVVALEFHVDYWDSLVYGTHGTHKDPFSDKENTYRQQVVTERFQRLLRYGLLSLISKKPQKSVRVKTTTKPSPATISSEILIN